VASATARVVPRAGHVPSTGEARSYLHDGRVVLWSAPGGLLTAVDAEVRRTPPRRISARAEGDVWEWWTHLEVVCKLLDLPVLHALVHGLPDHDCEVRVVEQAGVVIAFGARRP